MTNPGFFSQGDGWEVIPDHDEDTAAPLTCHHSQDIQEISPPIIEVSFSDCKNKIIMNDIIRATVHVLLVLTSTQKGSPSNGDNSSNAFIALKKQQF